MNDHNPYSTPEGDLIKETGQYGDTSIFSTGTRIGRLRYFARVSILALGFYLVMGVFVGLMALSGIYQGNSSVPVLGIIGALIYFVGIVAMLVFSFMFIVQRLHDLNHSGWMSLMMFIPLINMLLGLYVLFAPGTGGSNNYGPQPPPNTAGVKVAAFTFPALFILVAVLAAISIPAYQDYQQRAQQLQQAQPE